MKNQEQANNINNLNDPNVANDPQTLVEDLQMSGEQEERVKGGSFFTVSGFTGGVTVAAGDADRPILTGHIPNLNDK